MTIVNSKEFATNQDKYFDMAFDEQVYIKKDNRMFLLVYQNAVDANNYHKASIYNEVLEPDDDLRSAITGDELLERIYADIDKKFTSHSQ